ncbi:dihydrofolate reductase family protein [Kutzneria sp. CA-103260]|uniref:dihydrofolate reductase family protein n=1 Tax=Kutzneria sp. CA-103260 TaxID=2802641 RepID=UPI001BAE4D8B|nr:dihydrofolate reductase family protein [Kutzneria sp. CA-103260]QUQ71860.1 riboflavin biosynthesis protein RibD domain-containing protein [Kutzneria sp. CA-103260]
MAKLIYSMLMSLDGYVEDADGRFGWSAPSEEVHSFVNELATPIGTYLYGRRMYETMVFWETVPMEPDQPRFALDWARHWQGADKIVYSTTLSEPSSARTRIEREFHPDAVRRLKAESDRDIAVAGPALAARALSAGLVDECHLLVSPVVVGGGKRFFPDGVRLDLELVDERRFTDGVVFLRYATTR